MFVDDDLCGHVAQVAGVVRKGWVAGVSRAGGGRAMVARAARIVDPPARLSRPGMSCTPGPDGCAGLLSARSGLVRVSGEFSWVGEAEAGVAGGAFGEGGGEDRGVGVVVVVDLGGGLAGVGAENTSDVLDEASLEGEGIQVLAGPSVGMAAGRPVVAPQAAAGDGSSVPGRYLVESAVGDSTAGMGSADPWGAGRRVESRRLDRHRFRRGWLLGGGSGRRDGRPRGR